MNLKICKKCHLCPYLLKLEDFFSGKSQIITCTNFFKVKEALTVAELKEESFNKIIDYLVENYNYDKNNAYRPEAINLQKKIHDPEILKDIEINQICPYYFEQEMWRLNE